MPVGSNLGCIVLLSKVVLDPNISMCTVRNLVPFTLTLTVLVTTIDALRYFETG